MVGIEKGNIVKVKLVSSGKMIKGKVVSVAQAATFASQKATQNTGDFDIRSFGVKVQLMDLPSSVPVGMTVEWYGKENGTSQGEKAGEVK
ncbi:hypothetical protein D1872_299820 [compost metagenome]